MEKYTTIKELGMYKKKEFAKVKAKKTIEIILSGFSGGMAAICGAGALFSAGRYSAGASGQDLKQAGYLALAGISLFFYSFLSAYLASENDKKAKGLEKEITELEKIK